MSPLKLVVAAVAAAAIAVTAIMLIGGEEEHRIEPPDLGGELVEMRPFERCVRDAPAPVAGWRISGSFVLGRAPSGRPGAGGFQLAWRASDGQRTSSARAIAVASEAAAREIQSRFPEQLDEPLDEGPGYRTARWGNLLFRSYDGTYREAPPSAVTDLIRRCAERAATRPAPAGAELTDCPSPKRSGVFARQFVRNPSVRGLDCEAAEELLRVAVEGRTGTCRDFGPGFACFTEFYCCDAPVEYAGNGAVELVWDGGF